MERTYIQLNVVNLLTILIMASAGALVLGIIASGIATYLPGMFGGDDPRNVVLGAQGSGG